MTDKEKLKLADMIINAMQYAEHDRVVVRFYDRTKLTDKEIQRRSKNTLSGIGRSYSREAVCNSHPTPDLLIDAYYALKDGVVFEDIIPPGVKVIED
jgi:hypothetical protein